jgi:hypothetical protein
MCLDPFGALAGLQRGVLLLLGVVLGGYVVKWLLITHWLTQPAPDWTTLIIGMPAFASIDARHILYGLALVAVLGLLGWLWRVLSNLACMHEHDGFAWTVRFVLLFAITATIGLLLRRAATTAALSSTSSAPPALPSPMAADAIILVCCALLAALLAMLGPSCAQWMRDRDADARDAV